MSDETDTEEATLFEKQAAEIVAVAVESIGPGKTGTFAARMIQPEDDPRYEGGTILGRDAGWY